MEKYRGMLTSAVIIWVCFAISIFLVFFNYFAYGYEVEIKHILLTVAIAVCGVIFTVNAKNYKKQANKTISAVAEEEISI